MFIHDTFDDILVLLQYMALLLVNRQLGNNPHTHTHTDGFQDEFVPWSKRRNPKVSTETAGNGRGASWIIKCSPGESWNMFCQMVVLFTISCKNKLIDFTAILRDNEYPLKFNHIYNLQVTCKRTVSQIFAGPNLKTRSGFSKTTATSQKCSESPHFLRATSLVFVVRRICRLKHIETSTHGPLNHCWTWSETIPKRKIR